MYNIKISKQLAFVIVDQLYKNILQSFNDLAKTSNNTELIIQNEKLQKNLPYNLKSHLEPHSKDNKIHKEICDILQSIENLNKVCLSDLAVKIINYEMFLGALLYSEEERED